MRNRSAGILNWGFEPFILRRGFLGAAVFHQRLPVTGEFTEVRSAHTSMETGPASRDLSEISVTAALHGHGQSDF